MNTQPTILMYSSTFHAVLLCIYSYFSLKKRSSYYQLLPFFLCIVKVASSFTALGQFKLFCSTYIQHIFTYSKVIFCSSFICRIQRSQHISHIIEKRDDHRDAILFFLTKLWFAIIWCQVDDGRLALHTFYLVVNSSYVCNFE